MAVAAGAWILFTFPPETAGFYPPCVFRSATGLLCPGCGTTRALHHLLHGRIGQAFLLNPMIFAMAFTGLFAVPSVLRREVPPFMMKPWFAVLAATVVIGWTIVRNIFALA